jgi:hypothetical protein
MGETLNSYVGRAEGPAGSKRNQTIEGLFANSRGVGAKLAFYSRAGTRPFDQKSLISARFCRPPDFFCLRFEPAGARARPMAVTISNPRRTVMNTRYLITTALLAASLFAIDPASASSFLGSSSFGGKTTSVFKNDDGSHTVLSHDEFGRTHMETHGDIPAGPSGISVDTGNGWQAYNPKPKGKDSASTDFDGRKVDVTSNGDGSHTVNVTDENGTHTDVHDPIIGNADGISVDDGKGGWKPYEKPLRKKMRVVASTTFDGKTITVVDNGDGTHTVYTIDENGNTTTETHANPK